MLLDSKDIFAYKISSSLLLKSWEQIAMPAGVPLNLLNQGFRTCAGKQAKIQMDLFGLITHMRLKNIACFSEGVVGAIRLRRIEMLLWNLCHLEQVCF